MAPRIFARPARERDARRGGDFHRAIVAYVETVVAAKEETVRPNETDKK